MQLYQLLEQRRYVLVELRYLAVKIISISFQLIIKYVFLDDLRSMIGVIGAVTEIHKKNPGKTARDYDLCNKYTNLCRLVVIGFPIMYSILLLSFQMPAFFEMLTKGKIRPSIHIYLPDVNEFSVPDMTVLLLINIVLSAFETLVVIAWDTFIFINITSIPLFSTITQRQVNDLEDELRDRKKAGDLKRIKKQLIEIIEMQKKYNG